MLLFFFIVCFCKTPTLLAFIGERQMSGLAQFAEQPEGLPRSGLIILNGTQEPFYYIYVRVRASACVRFEIKS